MTWKRGKKCSRLDYVFISEHLINNTKDCEIRPHINTDHYLLEIKIIIDNIQKKGRGFWKLNTSLLADENYVRLIKENIKIFIKEISDVTDKTLAWDLLK